MRQPRGRGEWPPWGTDISLYTTDMTTVPSRFFPLSKRMPRHCACILRMPDARRGIRCWYLGDFLLAESEMLGVGPQTSVGARCYSWAGTHIRRARSRPLRSFPRFPDLRGAGAALSLVCFAGMMPAIDAQQLGVDGFLLPGCAPRPRRRHGAKCIQFELRAAASSGPSAAGCPGLATPLLNPRFVLCTNRTSVNGRKAAYASPVEHFRSLHCLPIRSASAHPTLGKISMCSGYRTGGGAQPAVVHPSL